MHTDELTEANDGSKQTLSSYWKTMAKLGYKPEEVKGEIIKLNQHLLKALQPFLRYFQKCVFPRSAPGKCFHVVGVDVLLDSNCKPWILEINASPSLNIDSTVVVPVEADPVLITNNPLKHKMNEAKAKYSTSNVDLHVKSMVLGHAVKLCKKSVDNIEDYEEYDSYTQIYSPEVEAQLFSGKNTYDMLLNIFIELSGSQFFPALTATSNLPSMPFRSSMTRPPLRTRSYPAAITGSAAINSLQVWDQRDAIRSGVAARRARRRASR